MRRMVFAALLVMCAAAIAARAEEPLTMIPARSDEGLRLTGADFEGRYRVPAAPDGAEITLDRVGFVNWMRRSMAETTLRDNQGQHGWLAEYQTADGRAFLWYPGNTKVVEGEWKVEPTPAKIGGRPFEIVQVCFRYFGDVIDPVKERPVSAWDCWPAYSEVENAAARAARGREIRPGDVFNLASGRVPHVLDKAVRPEWPAGTSP